MLALPRADIAIGSEVTRTRPLTTLRPGSTDIETTVSSSLARLSCADTTQTSGKLAFGILSVLGFDAGGATETLSSLTFDSMEIVSVADVGSLPLTEGAHYLWQGVRLRRFTLDFAGRNETQVNASIQEAERRLDASLAGGTGSTRTFSYDGEDLFVAWQIVRFGETQRRSEGEVRLEDDLSPTIDQYALDVLQIDGRWRVLIRASTSPTSDTVDLEAGRRLLARRSLGGGVQVDWLLVRSLNLAGPTPRGRLAIERQEVPFAVVVVEDE